MQNLESSIKTKKNKKEYKIIFQINSEDLNQNERNKSIPEQECLG